MSAKSLFPHSREILVAINLFRFIKRLLQMADDPGSSTSSSALATQKLTSPVSPLERSMAHQFHPSTDTKLVLANLGAFAGLWSIA